MINNRVPRILFLYWIIKVASTTLGETGADMFSMTFNWGYGISTLLFAGISVGLLILKLNLKKYNPVVYWALFTSTAIVGTEISDFIDRTLGLGYATGSALLISSLLVILFFWHKTEKTINVEQIVTHRAELFYWGAFLIANTLGTAAGDFLSDNLHLGFMKSALLISGVLVGIALVHILTRKWSVLLFWLAFVLTRPFGATFGDLLTKPVIKGGLGFGTIWASLFFAVILVVAGYKETRIQLQDKTSGAGY